MHRSMSENSKIRVKIAKEDMGAFVGFKTVWGWPTRSQCLAVTHEVIRNSGWKHYKKRFAITHIPTGYAALRNFRSVRQAQLAASVLAALPLNLPTVTKKNCWNRAKKLDGKWLEWFSQWKRGAVQA